MKAWEIIDTAAHPSDEDYAEIVLAETASKAKYHSELYANTMDWIGLKVKRAPGFDGDKLTERQYIENGWNIECSACSNMVHPADQVDEDYPDELPVFDEWGKVYHAGCLARRVAGGEN